MTNIPQAAVEAAMKAYDESPVDISLEESMEIALRAAAPFMLATLNPNERYWEGRWRDEIAQGTFADGVQAAAKVAENYKRDGSFDDSMVGAQEHNANQWNIAQAIRALKPEVKE